jgi:kynurenine formamidase
MCLPACQHELTHLMNRRAFMRTAAGMAVGGASAFAAESSPTIHSTSFRRVVDLTHTLSPDFPSYPGTPQFSRESALTLEKDGFNAWRWTVFEHVGTHFDAPLHISDGMSADQIPASSLVGPLVVVDIAAKAESNPDAELTPDDLKAWESAHGPLPQGAIVAMRSGWDAHIATPKFRNADNQNRLHFPGFHVEAVQVLLERRDVKGIAVDTLSLDCGRSARFPTHLKWLPAGKWGLECVTNLGELPAVGATIVVGAPKVAGASGGPSRVFALV